mmetsp:Transcript_82789/g.146249  ORF Transcript_82789/g.146249 Transcript_82789/m.146249 type:complete len:1112 (-) Transcript_82789:212-3547(-)
MAKRLLELCFVAFLCPPSQADIFDDLIPQDDEMEADPQLVRPVMRRQGESLYEGEVNEALQAVLGKVAHRLEEARTATPQQEHGLPRQVATGSKSAQMINNNDNTIGNSTEAAPAPVQYRYYRFTVLKVRKGQGQIAVSEFSLVDPESLSVKLSNPAEAEAETSSKIDLAPLFDNNPRTSVTFPGPAQETFTIKMLQAQQVTAFDFKTSYLRADFDPVSFKVEGSDDGHHWQELSEKYDFSTPFERGVSVGPFILSSPVVDKDGRRTETSERLRDAAARPIYKTVYPPAAKTVYVYDGANTTNTTQSSSSGSNATSPSHPKPCPTSNKVSAPPSSSPQPHPPLNASSAPLPPNVSSAPPYPATSTEASLNTSSNHYTPGDSDDALVGSLNYSDIKDRVRLAVLSASKQTSLKPEAAAAIADSASAEAYILVKGAQPNMSKDVFFAKLRKATHAAGMNSCQQGNILESAKNANPDDEYHILHAWEATETLSLSAPTMPRKIAAVVKAAVEAGMPGTQVADLAYDATVAVTGGWNTKTDPNPAQSEWLNLEPMARKATWAGLDPDQQTDLILVVYHMDSKLQAAVGTILDAAALPGDQLPTPLEFGFKNLVGRNAGRRTEAIELAAREAALSPEINDINACLDAAVKAAAAAATVTSGDGKIAAARDAAQKIANAVMQASATSGMDWSYHRSTACTAAAAAAASVFSSSSAAVAADLGGWKKEAAAAGMTAGQLANMAGAVSKLSDEELSAVTAALHAAAAPLLVNETRKGESISQVVKAAMSANLPPDQQAQTVAVAAAAIVGGGAVALQVLKESSAVTGLSELFHAGLAAGVGLKMLESVVSVVARMTPSEQWTAAASFKAADPKLGCNSTQTMWRDVIIVTGDNSTDVNGTNVTDVQSFLVAPNRCVYKAEKGEEAGGFYLRVSLAVDRLVQFISAKTGRVVNPASLSIGVSRFEFQWAGTTCSDSESGFSDFKAINFPNGLFANEQNVCGRLSATSTDFHGDVRLECDKLDLLWLAGHFGKTACDAGGDKAMMRIVELVITQHRADGSVEIEYSICGGKDRPSYIGCPEEPLVDIVYPANNLGPWYRLCTKFGRYSVFDDSTDCFGPVS